MDRIKRNLAVSLAVLFLFWGSAGNCLAQKDVNIAMVLWRGITKAEKGFQTGILDATNGEANFTIFDADRDKKKLAGIIDGIQDEQYDLIYSFGTTVTKSLKLKIKKTPIVFCIVSRPVKAGVIDSWQSSGNNVTGASNAVPMDSVFKTLAKIMKISKLGFLFNPNEANSRIQRDEIVKYQKRFKYSLVEAPVKDNEQIESAIDKLAAAKVDAVLLPSDSFVKAQANKIIPGLNEHKLPTIVSIPAMVQDNKAFLGLGPDYYELGKLAASKAVQILHGSKPTNVPSSTLERQHLTVNLATARKIGVSVPIQLLRISTIIK